MKFLFGTGLNKDFERLLFSLKYPRDENRLRILRVIQKFPDLLFHIRSVQSDLIKLSPNSLEVLLKRAKRGGLPAQIP